MTKRELLRGKGAPVSSYERKTTWKDILVDALALVFAVAALAFVLNIGAIVGF